MKPGADIRAFMARLGHDFARPELLVRALTHGSIASATRPDNQRLEFLGDRVLGLVMAEALFDADKSASEGQLAPRYNALVRGETCAAIAREIGLGDVLKLGRSEMMALIASSALRMYVESYLTHLKRKPFSASS